MFKFRSYLLASLLGLASLFWYSCSKKEESKPVTVPVLGSTVAVTNITETTASTGGDVTADGGSTVLARGVCYDTLAGPTFDNDHPFTSDGAGLGAFTSSLTNLLPGKKYYVRSFASNIKGIAYGSEVSFTTTSLPAPLLTTADITTITDTSAISGGNITNDFGTTITERGVCWSKTNSKPTLADKFKANSLGGAGSFSVSFAGLTPATTYNIRAYAKSSNGTIGFGSTLQFVTEAGQPTVTTLPISGITMTAANGGGEVVAANGSAVTARGVCYSTFSMPNTSDPKLAAGNGEGSFTSSFTGLTPGTKYYVRAYATNGKGTSYGQQEVFETSGARDIDGNIYTTVKIGTQTWMVENLRTTHLRDNTQIYNSPTSGNWVSESGTYNVFCYPDGNPTLASTMGLLYSYVVVSSNQLCPTGWKVPSSADFNLLESTLGGAGNAAKLKATSGWQFSSGISATNSSGFTGLPSGWRDSAGNFYDFGRQTHFRTTTPGNSGAHKMRFLNYDSNNFTERSDFLDVDGASVRCIKE